MISNLNFADIVLIFHSAITLIFAGIIWFVQIVHYPLLKFVGLSEIVKYETEHTRIVMRPAKIIMSLELASGILLLFFRPINLPLWPILLGLLLLGLIWYQTWFAQVPCHNALACEFSEQMHQRLLKTNWIRTLAYTLRCLLICFMIIISLMSK